MRKEIKYINYTCDCCRKESKDNNFLSRVILPAKRCIPSDYQGFWNFAISTACFEVCSDCIKKMYGLLDQMFEIKDVDYGEKSIRLRHKEEEDDNIVR